MGNQNKPKVLLTLEDGHVIVAKRYRWVSSGVIGIAAQCDDGSEEFFTEKSNPTHTEFYGIDVSNKTTYAEKIEAVKKGTGWSSDEEFPWLETDKNGDAIPGTDTLDRITNWLNTEIDANLLEYWGERTASQYAPGFAFISSLTDEEKWALRVGEGDLGGPASSVPCATTGASLAELNRIISQKGLPYVFVDVDGPEQG